MQAVTAGGRGTQPKRPQSAPLGGLQGMPTPHAPPLTLTGQHSPILLTCMNYSTDTETSTESVPNQIKSRGGGKVCCTYAASSKDRSTVYRIYIYETSEARMSAGYMSCGLSAQLPCLLYICIRLLAFLHFASAVRFVICSQLRVSLHASMWVLHAMLLQQGRPLSKS